MTTPPPIFFPGPDAQVTFDRHELSAVLSVYGRMVALTEARDYALRFSRDVAVFAIFRRTAETPPYRIEKRPALRLKQGQYALLGPEGQMLKRGSDLKTVLRVIERKLIRPVD